MKNVFFTLVFMLVGTFAFANETSNVTIDSESYIEYTIMFNKDGVDTCYARVCWNATETQRRCTDWQEVPCDAAITLEVLEP
jgi:hypothetical protein